MEIAYTAHTETCTLLLDAGGVCRSVLAASSRASSPGGRGTRPTRIPASAERCVGAQYVATLDLRETGGLTAMPLPGAQLLFARTEPNGRITLIRSAPVVRFEATPARIESGVHARPDSQPDFYAQPRSISQLDTQANAYGAEASGYALTSPYAAASPYASASPYAPATGSEDDEDLTIPCDAPTIPRGRRSSLPPDVRESGVVPAAPASSRRASIPPTPRLPRVQQMPDSVTRPTYNTIPGQPPPAYSPYGSIGRRTESTPAFSPYEAASRRGGSTPAFSPHESVTTRAPRPSLPTRPTRPSIVRISTTDATEWDVATRPYQRAAR